MVSTRAEAAARNAAMLREHRSGMSIGQIAQRHELTPKYVRKLLSGLAGGSLVEAGSFTHGWLSNPAAFARPGPPCPQPEQPGPVRFTCRSCGGAVSTRTWDCTGCKARFRVFAKSGADASRSEDGNRRQAEATGVRSAPHPEAATGTTAEDTVLRSGCGVRFTPSGADDDSQVVPTGGADEACLATATDVS
ncbi:hypothetical protein [Amycolatopsis sp. NPDC004079]|uniref:hypothetical protein n=1 Tax=Amycolatopsis sp. NPDC004079 TaxID=3154549 RepID=UPI0033B6DAAC